MAEEKAEEADVELATKKSGLTIKSIVIIAVVVIAVIAISIGTTIYFLSGSSSNSDSEKSDTTKTAEVEHVEVVSKPAIYFLFEPDFIINFENVGKANFLSVQIEAMAREQDSINIIQTHMPVLRNDILLLLSAQKYEDVRTLKGKNILRKGMLKIINKVINEENNNLKKKDKEDFHAIAHIEAIYFTGFIMQ